MANDRRRLAQIKMIERLKTVHFEHASLKLAQSLRRHARQQVNLEQAQQVVEQLQLEWTTYMRSGHISPEQLSRFAEQIVEKQVSVAQEEHNLTAIGLDLEQCSKAHSEARRHLKAVEDLAGQTLRHLRRQNQRTRQATVQEQFLTKLGPAF